MTQPPRMHGISHTPGGPDPTLFAWEDVDGGASGGLETTDGSVDVNPTSVLSIGSGITLTNPAAGEAHLAAGGGVSSATEQANSPGTVSISNNGNANLRWAHFGGSTLLDYTTDTAPKFISPGVYAVTAEFETTTTLTAGNPAYGTLQIVDGSPVVYQTNIFAKTSTGNLTGALTIIGKVTSTGTATLTLNVANRTGSTCVFRLVDVFIVRIF